MWAAAVRDVGYVVAREILATVAVEELRNELAQIQRVRLAGAAGVAGQDPGSGHDFRGRLGRLVEHDGMGNSHGWLLS
jgi:hypothetical protein